MPLEYKINEKQREKYRKLGYWGDATLVDYWQMAVRSVPGKTAVVDFQGKAFTYTELDEASGRVAAYLQAQGIGPGDFVTLLMPGWAEFTVIYLGCLKAGAICNALCPNYSERNLSYILNKCESKVLFFPYTFKKRNFFEVAEALRPNVPSLKQIVMVDKYQESTQCMTLEQVLRDYAPIRDDAKVNADELAAVLFTSGTEGNPKGVMLTHNNIIAAEKAFAARVNFNSFDTILMPAPVGHATGFHHGVTMPFLFGAKSVLQDIFIPENTLKLIEQEKCTCGMGATPFVHDILRALKAAKHDISSLRYFLCGGAPIPRHMVKEAMQAGFKVLGVYGSTESVPHTATALHDADDRIINSDGYAVAGVEIKIVDPSRNTLPPETEGEEASRGPNVFVGYLREPELTAKVLDEEGWYYSGDMCKMDADGYIRITGRIKDIIIRGGENISSCEVENFLSQHPNVREIAVVSMPDERLGEKVCAYVVLNDPAKGLTPEDLVAYFIEKKAPKYKCPERIEIVDRLPRTESGKVQKFLLRQDIRNKLNIINNPA